MSSSTADLNTNTYLRWDGCPIPDHCPRCPTFDERGLYNTNFFNDYRYQTLDHENDYLYKEMDYGGMVYMPNPEHGGKNENAVIAMFHQLHCVASMRNALQEAYDGKRPAFDWIENIHWPHCLDYLRKAILCYGDDTIERVTSIETFEGVTGAFINGTDDVRACKKINGLYDMREKHGIVHSNGQLYKWGSEPKS